MADLDELKQKYKFHEETLSYFKLRAEAGFGSYPNAPSIEAARDINLQVTKKFAGEVEFEGSVKEFIVPSTHVKAGIPVTVYRSKQCSLVGAPSIFVFFHGGGNVVGSRQTCDVICKIFSRDAPCVVVNVEYRLGPEHRFPASNDDAKCVVRWVNFNKSLIGAVNDSTIGVGGHSAGGRLAAVVSQQLRTIIDYQVLIYPNVDYTQKYPSQEEFENFPGLSKEMTQWFSENYIDESDKESVLASPLLNEKFNCLPPALIILAEFDVLKDAGVAYHNKLKKAGIPSQTHCVRGVTHGFFHLPGHFKECCKRAHEKVYKFIKASS
ncbi:AB hydrolase superfamily protein C1039.03-like isoform X2 [Mizuhopecten yessoensis]|uniref:AB hydrolase superfamily protein C1039.03-like isoform X2 n=1 Tax=Mizuhopecten yessoensis TaxID=6573 RepID=UPI000B45A301|nr:AB hydrolase superfamily protein C1039.03-like isoform X2 [Mizuhopecten yessoensis]